MEVKEVVALAKRYILEVYADEHPANVGLEEVEYAEGSHEWSVTIGFSRPWEQPRNALAAFASAHRSLKVLRIADADGRVLSIKNRATP